MILLALSLLQFGAVSLAEVTDASPRIRVRLTEGLPSSEVRGFDLQFKDSAGAASSTDKQSDWRLRCSDSEITLTSVKSSAKARSFKGPLRISTPAGFLTYRGRPYRDTLVVHARGQLCEVINEVSLEEYLDGLVNSEFSAKWSVEAVHAQVVAARTYAYFQILGARKRSKSRFDVDATVKDQVYDGSMKEHYKASRSVDKTRGWVLTTSANPARAPAPVPIKAFYHSSCGGMTELPEGVWGGSHDGFKQKVKCPHCAKAPIFLWELDLRVRDVAAAILLGARDSGAPSDWPDGWIEILRAGKLLDLRVTSKDESGRIRELATVWSDPDTQSAAELRISGNQFRNWMGPAKFRSTLFDVTAHRAADGNRWHFQGKGNGHGVGMCQWGAKFMGEKGNSMTAILKTYYPDAVLKKLW